jgi:di/tricarboxylate transporter
MLAAMIPIGTALQTTGLSEVISQIFQYCSRYESILVTIFNIDNNNGYN